ncbi:hypothetical protein Catovirus_1_657 [Catovirus CTV1]|uniref:Uncharacterized protein n=1 Tax=Catovirus CTV1 TaxID=1977631 RepID=A0A1V0SA61_9VIRU|nr:hypothetical protein Catovirus_1_657 [Catovirus CTV1]
MLTDYDTLINNVFASIYWTGFRNDSYNILNQFNAQKIVNLYVTFKDRALRTSCIIDEHMIDYFSKRDDIIEYIININIKDQNKFKFCEYMVKSCKNKSLILKLLMALNDNEFINMYEITEKEKSYRLYYFTLCLDSKINLSEKMINEKIIKYDHIKYYIEGAILNDDTNTFKKIIDVCNTEDKLQIILTSRYINYLNESMLVYIYELVGGNKEISSCLLYKFKSHYRNNKILDFCVKLLRYIDFEQLDSLIMYASSDFIHSMCKKSYYNGFTKAAVRMVEYKGHTDKKFLRLIKILIKCEHVFIKKIEKNIKYRDIIIKITE